MIGALIEKGNRLRNVDVRWIPDHGKDCCPYSNRAPLPQVQVRVQAEKALKAFRIICPKRFELQNRHPVPENNRARRFKNLGKRKSAYFNHLSTNGGKQIPNNQAIRDQHQ